MIVTIGLMLLARIEARLHRLWHRATFSGQAHHVWLDVCPSSDRGVFRVRGVHCTCGKEFWHEQPQGSSSEPGCRGEAGRRACDAGVQAAAHAHVPMHKLRRPPQDP
jgi:hypothetical protein